MKEIDKVYQDLKAKGIEFPMTDLDHLAPIYTPARVGQACHQQNIYFHKYFFLLYIFSLHGALIFSAIQMLFDETGTIGVVK